MYENLFVEKFWCMESMKKIADFNNSDYFSPEISLTPNILIQESENIWGGTNNHNLRATAFLISSTGEKTNYVNAG